MIRAYEGLYTGRWEVAFAPYRGVDFSRVCFTFPGQGAAAPGMLRSAYERLDVVRRRFAQADAKAAAEGLPAPSAYILAETGSADLARVGNLALCTLQVSLFEQLAASGMHPRVLTGFSQGEYPALVCAGALDFELMIDLLLARDRACPPANELGYLVAVEASPARIAQILDPRDYEVSNRNSPRQTAIAVVPQKVRQVKAAIAAQDIRCKVLDEVPQPYHSSHLRPAAERFRAWLEPRAIRLRPPRLPILSSVTKRFLPKGGLDVAAATDLLARQIAEPVDFVRQVRAAHARRCFSFLEVGPGATLATFVRDILGEREHKILELAGYLPGEARPERPPAVELARSPLFAVLRRAIARVSGYEIESISIEDRFQEDLGIDSIKKAEILVTITNDGDRRPIREVDVAAIRSLEDAVYLFSAPRGEDPETAEPAPRPVRCGRHVLRWRRRDLPPPRAARELPPERLIRLKELLAGEVSGDEIARSEGGVVLVAGERDLTGDLAADLAALVRVVLCFRAFARADAGGDLDLCLVTAGESPAIHLGLAGFFKALRKEVPRLFFRHLHLDRMPSPNELLRLVGKERLAGGEIEVRYSGGVRAVAGLEPLSEPPGVATLPPAAVVVALGGAKGITRALLARLARSGRAHLYLAGRSPREQVSDALDELSRWTPHVHYESLDARSRDAVAALLASVVREHGRVDLVLNAVGIERSARLAAKTEAEVAEELLAKVLPAAHVLAAAAQHSAGLVIQFSSLAARWGNPGQTVYSCANEIVNGLTAAHNRALGRRAAVAVEWPPWDGVGMTANPGVLHRLRRIGFGLLRPDEATGLLACELGRPRHDVVQYVDPADLALLGLTLGDHRPHRALIGDPTTDYRFERVLERRKDPWLADHRIDGTSYLPAASAMAMALCVGSLATDGANRLEDFHIVRPVPVRDEPVALRLEPVASPAGLGLRGRTGSTTHFTCRVTGPSELAAPPAREGLAGRRIEPDRLYTEELFFHGPTFQVLHDVRLSADGRVAVRIETPRLLPVVGVAAWDRLVQWLDGAFQALALAAMARRPVMAIPVAVGRMTFAPERCLACSTAVVLPEITAVSDEEVCGDVLVAGEEGQALLRLRTVRLRVLRALAREPLTTS